MGNLCGLVIYQWSSDLFPWPVECDLYFRPGILKSKRIYQCSMLTLERTRISERPCNSEYLVVIEWGWADQEGCYRPRWITTSEISIILHILWKLNSIIVLLFIQHISKTLKEENELFNFNYANLTKIYSRSKIIFALHCSQINK